MAEKDRELEAIQITLSQYQEQNTILHLAKYPLMPICFGVNGWMLSAAENGFLHYALLVSRDNYGMERIYWVPYTRSGSLCFPRAVLLPREVEATGRN